MIPRFMSVNGISTNDNRRCEAGNVLMRLTVSCSVVILLVQCKSTHSFDSVDIYIFDAMNNLKCDGRASRIHPLVFSTDRSFWMLISTPRTRILSQKSKISRCSWANYERIRLWYDVCRLKVRIFKGFCTPTMRDIRTRSLTVFENCRDIIVVQ